MKVLYVLFGVFASVVADCGGSMVCGNIDESTVTAEEIDGSCCPDDMECCMADTSLADTIKGNFRCCEKSTVAQCEESDLTMTSEQTCSNIPLLVGSDHCHTYCPNMLLSLGQDTGKKELQADGNCCPTGMDCCSVDETDADGTFTCCVSGKETCTAGVCVNIPTDAPTATPSKAPSTALPEGLTHSPSAMPTAGPIEKPVTTMAFGFELDSTKTGEQMEAIASAFCQKYAADYSLKMEDVDCVMEEVSRRRNLAAGFQYALAVVVAEAVAQQVLTAQNNGMTAAELEDAIMDTVTTAVATQEYEEATGESFADLSPMEQEQQKEALAVVVENVVSVTPEPTASPTVTGQTYAPTKAPTEEKRSWLDKWILYVWLRKLFANFPGFMQNMLAWLVFSD